MKHKQTKVKWNQSLRFGTISHILASTDLNCCTKKEDVLSDEALIEKNAVEIVKQMQRLKGIDGDYDSDSAASNRLAQRHTIQVDKDLIFPIRAQHIFTLLTTNNPFYFYISIEICPEPRAESTKEKSNWNPWCCLQETILCSLRYCWTRTWTFCVHNQKLNAQSNSFYLSGEEDAPGGQADGTPKPHNINRKKACIKIKLIMMLWNPIPFTHLFADTPILGSRMPMRRETLKAIETARDNLMQVLFFLPSTD